jgi:hypothetical protein
MELEHFLGETRFTPSSEALSGEALLRRQLKAAVDEIAVYRKAILLLKYGEKYNRVARSVRVWRSIKQVGKRTFNPEWIDSFIEEILTRDSRSRLLCWMHIGPVSVDILAECLSDEGIKLGF